MLSKTHIKNNNYIKLLYITLRKNFNFSKIIFQCLDTLLNSSLEKVLKIIFFGANSSTTEILVEKIIIFVAKIAYAWNIIVYIVVLTILCTTDVVNWITVINIAVAYTYHA
jgi:hypothetical protein